MADNDTGKVFRALTGGGVGFILGMVAILSLGVIGIAAPFLGLIIGITAGALLSRYEARAFLLGYIATGLTVALTSLLLLRLGSGASGDPTAVWFLSGIFGNGSALIGSVIAAVWAGNYAPSDERSSSVKIILLAIPVLLLGVFVLGMSIVVGDRMPV